MTSSRTSFPRSAMLPTFAVVVMALAIVLKLSPPGLVAELVSELEQGEK